MWLARRGWIACVKRTVLSSQASSQVTPLRCCATTSSPSTFTSSQPPAATSQGPVSLAYTCRLLDSICTASQPLPVKRKRVRGAIRKMESDIVSSFAAASAALAPEEKQDFMRQWLRSLSGSVAYLPRQDLAAVTEGNEAERYSARSPRRTRRTAAGDDEAWSGASPFFDLQTNDVLCLCLRECAMSTAAETNPAAMLELLRFAVELELGDVEVLQHMVHALTSAEATRARTASEVVELLHCISLAVKRCKVPAPPLDRLLCVLPSATLSPRESLLVLSALHRIPNVHAGDVVASVSRRAAAQVPAYTVKDVIFGLEVAALLAGCNETYVSAVLDRAGVLAPSLTPRQLGSVCKYVALLNPTRRQNTLAYSCGAELRHLLPLLVERTEQLLGQFHLRDSRNVLRCFREHKVRHSLIFSRLTPLAEDN